MFYIYVLLFSGFWFWWQVVLNNHLAIGKGVELVANPMEFAFELLQASKVGGRGHVNKFTEWPNHTLSPRHSMDDIFIYIWWIIMVNVGKYTIDWASGYGIHVFPIYIYTYIYLHEWLILYGKSR